ncbi:MAG: FtsX-like permease family protein [Cyclobacteriaceae bacterium]
MLINYIKLAVRLLIRNPFFSVINILGLSVGFTVFFVLWQYSQRELNSDRQWKDWERIVRLTRHLKFESYESTFGYWPAALPKIFSEAHPEISEVLRICSQNNFRSSFANDHDKEIFLSRYLQNGERIAFVEHDLAYADPNLFTFFSIPLLFGAPESVLQQSSSLVLSEKLSKKYFGDEDPIGKMIMINDAIPLTVTGVFKDLPSNSHLQFEAVLSVNRIEHNINTVDLSKEANFSAYFKLSANCDRVLLSDKINKTIAAVGEEEFKKRGLLSIKITSIILPIEEVAFTMWQGDSFKSKSRTTLQVFRLVAIIVLALAWINYINLSLALNRKRTKEVATRRTLGAQPGQVMTQFLMEAGLINLLAMLASLTSYQLLKQPVDLFFDFSAGDINETSPSSIFWISVVVISGVTISGLYPALISMNRSSGSLSVLLNLHASKNTVGRLLTITQFIIAITLVIWMFSINSQIKYILNKDLGISKDQIVVVDLPYRQPKSFFSDLNSFSSEIGKIPGVLDYATSSSVAGDTDPNAVRLQRNEASELLVMATNGGIDERFMPLYDIKVLTGRNFLPQNKSDEKAIILSKKAVEKLGYTVEDALGRRILVQRRDWMPDMQWIEIIGIIEDYDHQPFLNGFQGYYNNDMGIALTYGSHADEENRPRKVSIEMGMPNFDKALNKVKEVYETTFHGNLFSWTFLDDNINRHYENEKNTGNQILLFTCLAIGIACLGLLGMISNIVLEKTKEIGIRKVLGAKLHEIAKILLSATIKQAIIATVIGIPVGYHLSSKYLERFSDRIILQWWHFSLPIVMLIAIMVVTIASVIWRAVRTNPVESLRYE